MFDIIFLLISKVALAGRYMQYVRRGRCVCLYKRRCGSSEIASCSAAGSNIFENIYFLRETIPFDASYKI